MKNSFYLVATLSLGLIHANAQQDHFEIALVDKDKLPKSIKTKLSSPAKSNNVEEYKHSSFSKLSQEPTPVIITAIPYHGHFSTVDDYPDIEISPDSSQFRLRSNFLNPNRPLYTYDSSEIYFLSPDIDHSNANRYQYRLWLNGKTVVQPWQDILNFTDKACLVLPQQICTAITGFKNGIAFFGAFKTNWNNSLKLELKTKINDRLVSSTIVSWQPVKPALQNIYTADELDIFLDHLKKPNDHLITNEALNKWKQIYKPGELDPATGLPKKLTLEAAQNNIIFYLQGDFHNKDDIEYQVLKNGTVYHSWKPNDFNNNFIWLKNLTPGNYELQMRFCLQRHNITNYPFYIEREWSQTLLFKIGLGSLAIFILLLLFWLWKQKQKIIAEKTKTLAEISKKEKFRLELKAIRSQLNPHFVSNALSSIQGLMNKNELRSANHYFVEFSHLLRQSLEKKDTEFVPLEEELSILETYIQLEQLRFHFQYDISMDESLVNVEIPSLLLQPLVENAIKHGAGPKHEKGLLIVRFSASGRNMLIDIIDNGAGFHCHHSNQGFGLRLVNDRIQLLNDSLNGRQIHHSISRSENVSTIVHLLFKNWI